MEQTRPTPPPGSDDKKDNTEVPKTMATAGQLNFRIVQVVSPGAAPSFVLVPTTALVGTADTTQTLPETAKPTCPQDPGVVVDANVVAGTQEIIEVTVSDGGTQKAADAEITKTADETLNSSDAGDDRTESDQRTQNSTRTSLFGGKTRRPNTCTSPVKNNVAQFPALKDYLPASYNGTNYDYHVCHYQAISETSDHVNFRANLRMTLTTVDEIKQWIKLHSATWRNERNRKATGQKVIFKTEYRCQHNTKHNPKPETIAAGGRKPTSKDTNCPAKMAITLLQTKTSKGLCKGRSSDPHVPAFPTIVNLRSEHNHNVNGTEALRYRDVGDKAREKLLKLFEAGHNPTSALEVLKIDLQVEHGENYAAAVANKELCPTLEFCYRLRYKHFGKMRSSTQETSLLGSQKKRNKKKKKACPADEEQTDKSSQQNPSQEECEAASAADFLSLSLPSDYEDDDTEEDVVESMIRDISSLRKDPSYSQAVIAMAKQFRHIKSKQSRLLSAMHCFGKSQSSSKRASTTRRPDALSPCRPAATPRPVAKLSSKKRLPSGPQQRHSATVKRPRMMDYHL